VLMMELGGRERFKASHERKEFGLFKTGKRSMMTPDM